MSDALVDPLTGLITPFNFYESARRIKSWADRKDQPITLIAIDLADLADFDKARVAREMLKELRGGDLLARMREREFLLLMLGDVESAGHLIFRLSNKIKPKLEFRARLWSPEESLIDSLESLGV
jgi:GGDEF domain-containing protein